MNILFECLMNILKDLMGYQKKMGLKKSDIVRLALKKFLDENSEGIYQSPFQQVKSILGVVESGIKDLGQRHRYHSYIPSLIPSWVRSIFLAFCLSVFRNYAILPLGPSFLRPPA